MYVACLLVPRFSLLAACRDRESLLRGPAALAPEPGRETLIGEASGAAETHGVRAGMRLGEALARCPDLVLVPPDPELASELWEEALAALEGIGAKVESGRPGEAFFAADGLRGLYGGPREVLRRARAAMPMPARAALAPTRFAAFAAASRGGGVRRRRRRPGGGAFVSDAELRGFLRPLPVALLGEHIDAGGGSGGRELVAVLERLGIATVGALGALPAAAVADRFGALGTRARRLARGGAEELRPRRPGAALHESLELPEAADGPQLERALELLVDRLLAAPARHGRTFRSLRLGARLAGGGGWRCEVALRQASGSAEILRIALAPRLGELPAPASLLHLTALELGPAAGQQLELDRSPRERRRERMREAVRQTRAAAGPEALLRVLEVDRGSRVPERREMLTPFEA
jgi:nucleotidyltransferase/DNA polymerase involved in DNA repair